jgi:hypothetical protein
MSHYLVVTCERCQTKIEPCDYGDYKSFHIPSNGSIVEDVWVELCIPCYCLLLRWVKGEGIK